jgi:hypothetical protein
LSAVMQRSFGKSHEYGVQCGECQQAISQHGGEKVQLEPRRTGIGYK